jgi:hypothetical protein
MRTVIFVIGFIGAGLAGAVGGRVLFPVEAPLTGDPGVPARVTARLDDLEAQIARLSETVNRDLAPPLPDPIVRVDGRVPHAEEPAQDPDVVVLEVSEGVIEEKVREAIDERVKAQREEHERRVATQKEQKVQAWLEKWQKELGLTDYQREELGKQFRLRQKAIDDYKRTIAERGSDITEAEKALLTQEVKDVVRQSDAELKSLLSTQQYEKLMEAYSGGKRR